MPSFERPKTPERLSEQLDTVKRASAKKFEFGEEDLEKSPEELKQKYGEESYNEYAKELKKVKGDERKIEAVLQNIENGKFEFSQFDKIPEGLSNVVGTKIVEHKDKLGLDDKEIAAQLIEKDPMSLVFNLEKFEGIDHQAVAEQLVERDPYLLLRELTRFEGIDQQKIADRLTEKDPILLFNHMHEFKEFDTQKLAEQLAEKSSSFLLYNKEKFEGADWQKIANKLVEKDPAALLHNLEKFEPNIDKEKLADEFAKKAPKELMIYLDKFHPAKRMELAVKIIDTNPDLIIANLHQFSRLDIKLVEKLAEMAPEELILNLDKVPPDKQLELATRIMGDKPYLIVGHLNKFSNVDGKFLNALLEKTNNVAIAEQVMIYARNNNIKVSLKFRAKFGILKRISS